MTQAGKIYDRFLWCLAVFSAGILAAIALAIAVNVTLRNLELPVIYGTLDAIEYALLIATFLGAPWVLSIDGHVKVDLVSNSVGPGTQRILSVVACLIGAGTAAVLAWFGVQALLASFARGSMIRTAFVIPEWWMLTIVPFSMLLCMIEFLRKAFGKTASQTLISGL